jgi:hypothetical protein
LLSSLLRAGEWFLHSGIQEPNGGVARFYSVEEGCNRPVSTEITGYVASALVYLHTLTKDPRYLERATLAARFLAHTAWDAEACALPYELDPPALAYFFDCGIVVRGLLAVWRAKGGDEFLEAAVHVGRAMARDFRSADGCHPVLALPEKRPLERDAARWSRSAGCYQLKSAMAWWDLWEATGNPEFRDPYRCVLEDALRTAGSFLPGHPDRDKVMDRLHAFVYFLEGLLPCAAEPRCAAALRDGVRTAERHFAAIAPEFERADVRAQLLRIRLYADWAGAAALDLPTARREATRLAAFQVAAADRRIDGGYYFACRAGAWAPHVSPVSTAFALQALALWEQTEKGGAQPHRHLLI